MPEIKKIDFSLNEADHWLLANWPQIEEVLAILFVGRSGTAFLGSLLDNHPQVIMFPGTHLSLYEDFWETKGSKASSLEIIIRQFCAYFAFFFDVYAYSPVILGDQPACYLGFDKMGFERKERAEIDKTKFIAVLSLILSDIPRVDRKTFFQAIHVALTITVGRSEQLDRTRLPMIVYALHQNAFSSVNRLCADFPKTKMIHMIREPLQAMGSHFKTDGYCCHIMRDFFFDAFPKAGKERSRGLKLEDLHTQPQCVLKKMIQWVGLEWSNTLLESTFNGKKWWNMTGSEQLSGFNQKTISKNYNNFYYHFDFYRLKILYEKRLTQWSYPITRSIFKIERILLVFLLLIPFKMEMMDLKKNVISQGLKGVKYGFFCWLDRIRKRGYLFSAWNYSLSKEIQEIELL